MAARERAPRGVFWSFLLGTAAAVLFAVAYGLDAPTPVLGLAIGSALGLLALGLVLWSRIIDRAEPDYVEERELGPAPPRELDAFRRALTASPVPRARVLWSMFGMAVGALGVAALFPLRSLLPSAGTNPDRELSRTAWRRGRRLVTEDGLFVRPEDIETGGVLTVYPERYDKRLAAAATLLVRVPSDELELPAGRRSWVVDGVVAYSKLCTHAGCPVALYAEESRQLLCPCHHSVFDVLRGAEPVEGPAAHALPQLPIGRTADGFLVALGDFSGPVGAAWWGYES